MFEVLGYVLLSNPKASDTEKVQRLFDMPPTHLKGTFVRDPPKAVQAFIARLKDVSREQRYNEKALFSAGAYTSGISSAISTLAEEKERPSTKSLTVTQQTGTVKPVYFTNESDLSDSMITIKQRQQQLIQQLQQQQLQL